MIVITVARKPLEGTVAKNALQYGTGGINIDASRISVPPWKWGTQTDIRGGGYGSRRPSDGSILARDVGSHSAGRWPANLILSHLFGCLCQGTKQVKPSNGSGKASVGANGFRTSYVGGDKKGEGYGGGFADAAGEETVAAWECEAGCPVAALDEQSGILKSGTLRAEVQKGSFGQNGVYGKAKGHQDGTAYEQSSGGASRFFKQVHNKGG